MGCLSLHGHESQDLYVCTYVCTCVCVSVDARVSPLGSGSLEDT